MKKFLHKFIESIKLIFRMPLQILLLVIYFLLPDEEDGIKNNNDWFADR